MAIHFKLFEHIVNYPTGNSSQAWQANDDFLNSLSPAKTYLEKSVTTDISAGETGKANASMSVAPTRSKFEAGLSQEATKNEKISTSYDVSTEDKVFFPALHSNLEKTLSFGETRLYILLDEWASLPTDIQPYLAEFLKRGVLPVQKATVKIASLEYRSQFFASTEHGIIGFELGADIATGLDLDD